jgi:hypothetical protein
MRGRFRARPAVRSRGVSGSCSKLLHECSGGPSAIPGGNNYPTVYALICYQWMSRFTR